jgi:quinol monooxygenase YgiN
MTAFNAVRFRVKPGRDQEFLDAHERVNAEWPGLRRVNMIKTGERSYCIIAEWDDMDALAKARPNMIAHARYVPRHAGRPRRRTRRHRSGRRAGGADSEVASVARMSGAKSGTNQATGKN